MTVRMACIVEGHGETDAVPILVRRIARLKAVDVEIAQPIRRPKDKLLKEGELEKAVELAARKMGGDGGILLMVDADTDCPAEAGPHLLKRVREARRDVPAAVVLAKQEYEAWFLAAAISLRGKRGLPGDLEPPPDPEAVRGAKEWLSQRRTDAHGYSETIDQPALTAVMDLDAARMNSSSFDKCYREIEGLLETLSRQAGSLPG